MILLGPNGTGKSSLIDLINRNLYPIKEKNSSLKIFDKELINLWDLRKKISTVNNEIRKRINPEVKIFDLILSGLYGKYCLIRNKSERDIFLTENIINEINIDNLSQKRFSSLSEGEKQIVIIARALVNNPQILILDEPTVNLDYRSKFYVIDKINTLSKKNVNIFCITHDISMITKIYNRIIMLKDGKIIADGNQSKVLNTNNINRLYGIDVEVIYDRKAWNIYRKLENNNK